MGDRLRQRHRLGHLQLCLIAAITIAVRPGKVDPKTLRVPVAFFFAAAAIYCVAAYAMGEFTRPLGL